MKNKMEELARLAGLELEEEFRMNNYSTKYKITNHGFMYWSDDYQQWNYTCGIEELFLGKSQIVKIPKQILEEKEKEYLSAVIKPFIKKVKYIRKNKKFSGNYEYISIEYYDSTGGCALNFPDFDASTMYRGMETGKPYTLRELGL